MEGQYIGVVRGHLDHSVIFNFDQIFRKLVSEPDTAIFTDSGDYTNIQSSTDFGLYFGVSHLNVKGTVYPVKWSNICESQRIQNRHLREKVASIARILLLFYK